VGVTRWCPAVASVGNLPLLGDCWRVESIEAIAKLRPSLIVGSVPFHPEAVQRILEIPAQFLALNPRTLGNIESDIQTLALITDRARNGRELICHMRTEFAKIQRIAEKSGHKPRVYSEAWPNPRISSPPWVAELIEICGGRMMLKPGAKVSAVQIPDGPYEECAELTILMEAASSFQDLIRSGRCSELVDPVGQINGYASGEFSSVDYLQVQRVRAFLQLQIDRLFDEFDVLATAGESSAASPLSAPPEEDSAGPIARREPDGISSLCGLPALSVPCGFSKDRLPFGVQFIARALDDHAVIAAAHTYQWHTDWHRQHPSLS